MRHTKMLFTLGPATDRPGALAALLRAGMNGARFNFSHGTHADHIRRFRQLKALARRLEQPVAMVMDLSGPKLRIGALENGQVQLRRGARVRLAPGSQPGNAEILPISYRGLAQDVRPGQRLLLDDGAMELAVIGTQKQTVVARVMRGGLLLEHKGLNVPEAALSVAAVTTKDKQDLQLAVQLGFDYVALSFVRSAAEVRWLKNWLVRAGSPAGVIAKLEKPQAIEHLEDIVKSSDGVMVARGDLGVEMSPEQVPPLQKRIIALANRHGRLVITATQMLQSMMESPIPTRAEASDVANAIYDGTDVVMLSGETASGNYPVEAGRMMARIIAATEEANSKRCGTESPPILGVDDALVKTAVELAEKISAQALVVFTQSGATAKLISRRKPGIPLIAFAHDEIVQRRLNLYWGMTSYRIKTLLDTEHMVHNVGLELERRSLARKGDSVVILASTPVVNRSHVNFLKIHKI